ncbi:SH3 domain-containing protein [Sandarakinorhabdus sp.]|uniref:SH3 domain-containing protein n=1 Tax=Sandarakinorhabdus sp. TaxID=1916663 RepID=UPI003F6FBB94
MRTNLLPAAALAMLMAAPALAKDAPAPALAKCPAILGTVALVDGDTQGWTKFGLGSPRPLVAAMAQESGCFTLHNPASGTPANFLMNVIAGSKEEVDQGVDVAKTAATEALVRSGALARIPGVGGMMGMFGGMGGKKKTIAAGIRMISPQNGMTIASGSGDAKSSSISFGGMGAVGIGASEAGYDSKDGKMLAEAFIVAFNAVVAQGSALQAAAVPVQAVAAAAPGAQVAVDTTMFAAPNKTAAVVRSLRAGTSLKPTGKREGMFVELADNFGSSGWVSVEDLK